MKIFILMLMLLFTATSCTQDKKSLAEASVPSGSEEDPDSKFAALDSPLYLQLATKWEGMGEDKYEIFGDCVVDKNATIGTTKTCEIAIPEAQLYFSDLKFIIGTNKKTQCSVVSFIPYSYQRSNNNKYVPAGSSAEIDCSPTAPSKLKACYGGAGPAMVTNFPNNHGYYFLTSLMSRSSFELSSENKTRQYGGNHVNYLVTNDATVPQAPSGAGQPRDRLANSWNDYEIECNDIWGETQFAIKLIIHDEDLDETQNDPSFDQYTDWP